MRIESRITLIDTWLDSTVPGVYKEQPLAQDWARISKIGEEYGEAVNAFIGATGQNPRKGVTHTRSDVLGELADVALTAILAIQHFTKDPHETLDHLESAVNRSATRATRYEYDRKA